MQGDQEPLGEFDLIDRYFANDPRIAAGYVQPSHPIQSQPEQRKIGELIHSVDPDALVTGWSYTLWDLIPWAKGELVEFTTIVGVLILALLWIVYRKFSLWLVHASALAMSMLGLVATLGSAETLTLLAVQAPLVSVSISPWSWFGLSI